MAEIIDVNIDSETPVPRGYNNARSALSIWLDVADILIISESGVNKCLIELTNGKSYKVNESITSLVSRVNNMASTVTAVVIYTSTDTGRNHSLRKNSATVYLNPTEVVEIRQDSNDVSRIIVSTGKFYLSPETSSNLAQLLSVYSGGATTPGGSDTHVQFNDGGSTFGGDAGLTYNKTTDTLTGVIVKATSGISGSLTRLTDGRSYIVAGTNVTITSASNGQITVNSSGGAAAPTPTLQQTYNAGVATIGVNNSTGSFVLSGGLSPIGFNFPPLLRLEPGIGGPYATNFNAIDIFGYAGSPPFVPYTSASLINIGSAGSLFGGAQITLRSTGDFNSKIGWVAGAGGLYGSSPDAEITYHPNANALKFKASGAGKKIIFEDGGGYGGNLLTTENAAGSGGGTINLLPSKPNGYVINSGSLEQSGSAKFYSGLSGSLTQLTNGTSYLTAGSGIVITSQSNGPVNVGSTIWEWNGQNVSQFDAANPVFNTGQSGSIAFGTGSLAVNKVSTSIDITGTWTGSGGAVAYRVATSEGLTLPERFRIRLGLGAIPSGIRIGFMFYDPGTWSAANLLAGAISLYPAAIYPLSARGSAAGAPFAPFNFPGATYSFANQFTNDFGETLCEWDCVLIKGSGGNKPAIMLHGQTLSSYGTTSNASITVDRGILIGNGSYNDPINAVFNNATLSGFAVVAMSTALGTYTAKITRLQILKAI